MYKEKDEKNHNASPHFDQLSKKPCGNEIISKKQFDYLRISILLFTFADIIINCQQYDIINADTSG